MTRARVAFVLAVAAGVVSLMLTSCMWSDRAVVHLDGVTVRALVADRLKERDRGLQGLRELDANEGMLFVWPAEDIRTFGIKGVSYPLDLVFFDEDHVVVGVATLEPGSVMVASCPNPAQTVLEVPAGFVEQHSIAEGDRARIEGID